MSTMIGATATTSLAGAARPASLDAVLAYAWDVDAFTATDAIEATGLTRSTAIETTEELIARGLLRELPNARAVGDYRKGRPARRFCLREDAAVLVGVDAGSELITVRVTDLRSRELTTRRVDVDPALGGDADVDPAERRAVIVAAVRSTLTAVGCTAADVLALAVGVPAPVNKDGVSPRHPTGFWQRTNPGLIHAFDGIPLVRVHNDASLAAIAEGSVGAAVGCRDYVTLLAGVRMGAGVVIDGRLLHGAHGGVGEMVAFDHVEGVASADGLGARLSTWAAELVATGGAAPGSALAAVPSDRLDAAAVLTLAADGDADARALTARAGATLGRVVSVLGSMFDPRRIILSGPLSRGAEIVVDAARAALPTDLDLPAPALVASDLGDDVVVIGAVAAASALARDHALDVRPA